MPKITGEVTLKAGAVEFKIRGLPTRIAPCCRFHEHGGRRDWECGDKTWPEFLEWLKNQT